MATPDPQSIPATSPQRRIKLRRKLWILFRVFATISAVALGGGLVMLPFFQREFVLRRKWLTEDDMIETVAIMQSLPGIVAVNMSSLIGYRIAGIPGVLAATLGVITPPFVVIVIIAAIIFNFCELTVIQHIFAGIRAAVCAIVLAAVIGLARKTLKGSFELIVAAVGFIAILVFDVNAITLVICSALCGIVASYGTLRRAREAGLKHPDEAGKKEAEA